MSLSRWQRLFGVGVGAGMVALGFLYPLWIPNYQWTNVVAIVIGGVFLYTGLTGQVLAEVGASRVRFSEMVHKAGDEIAHKVRENVKEELLAQQYRENLEAFAPEPFGDELLGAVEAVATTDLSDIVADWGRPRAFFVKNDSFILDGTLTMKDTGQEIAVAVQPKLSESNVSALLKKVAAFTSSGPTPMKFILVTQDLGSFSPLIEQANIATVLIEGDPGAIDEGELAAKMRVALSATTPE